MKNDNDSYDEQPKYFNSQILTAHWQWQRVSYCCCWWFFFSSLHFILSSFLVAIMVLRFRSLYCLVSVFFFIILSLLTPFASEYFVFTFGRFSFSPSSSSHCHFCSLLHSSLYVIANAVWNSAIPVFTSPNTHFMRLKAEEILFSFSYYYYCYYYFHNM